MWVHYVVLIVSVLSWVMVAYFISSFIILDFEYYHVSIVSMARSNRLIVTLLLWFLFYIC